MNHEKNTKSVLFISVVVWDKSIIDHLQQNREIYERMKSGHHEE